MQWGFLALLEVAPEDGEKSGDLMFLFDDALLHWNLPGGPNGLEVRAAPLSGRRPQWRAELHSLYASLVGRAGLLVAGARQGLSRGTLKGSAELSGRAESQMREGIVGNESWDCIPCLAVEDSPSPCSAHQLGAAVLLVEVRGPCGFALHTD